MSTITAALLVVTADDGDTHLVATSPALHGARPEDRDVLCGARYASESTTPIMEIDCGDCLLASQRYWSLPAWAERVLP